eukprot:800106_1
MSIFSPILETQQRTYTKPMIVSFINSNHRGKNNAQINQCAKFDKVCLKFILDNLQWHTFNDMNKAVTPTNIIKTANDMKNRIHDHDIIIIFVESHGINIGKDLVQCEDGTLFEDVLSVLCLRDCFCCIWFVGFELWFGQSFWIVYMSITSSFVTAFL